jgi:2-methylcitrate dehydratase
VDELRKENDIDPASIESVELTTFLTAYHIIGSGAYGDRQVVTTKEQADHSLFYAAAVLLLDGEVYPAQYEPERIKRRDVQELLQKVEVSTGFPLHEPLVVAGVLDPYTMAYPDKMKTKVEIHLKDGNTYKREQEDYHGFFTRPFTWEDTIEKFRRLSDGIVSTETQEQLIAVVRDLENSPDLFTLINLLAAI